MTDANNSSQIITSNSLSADKKKTIHINIGNINVFERKRENSKIKNESIRSVVVIPQPQPNKYSTIITKTRKSIKPISLNKQDKFSSNTSSNFSSVDKYSLWQTIHHASPLRGSINRTIYKTTPINKSLNSTNNNSSSIQYPSNSPIMSYSSVSTKYKNFILSKNNLSETFIKKPDKCEKSNKSIKNSPNGKYKLSKSQNEEFDSEIYNKKFKEFKNSLHELLSCEDLKIKEAVINLIKNTYRDFVEKRKSNSNSKSKTKNSNKKNTFKEKLDKIDLTLDLIRKENEDLKEYIKTTTDELGDRRNNLTTNDGLTEIKKNIPSNIYKNSSNKFQQVKNKLTLSFTRNNFKNSNIKPLYPNLHMLNRNSTPIKKQRQSSKHTLPNNSVKEFTNVNSSVLQCNKIKNDKNNIFDKAEEKKSNGLLLDLDGIRKADFNEEFLEDVDNFSPSWREGCRKINLIK